MTEMRTYLRFDGILHEDMDFEPRRGWETPRILVRPEVGDGTYQLELLDEAGRVLIPVSPAVNFRDGCFSTVRTMRAVRVTTYLPYHPAARRVLFRRDDYVIYEAEVAKEPPSIALTRLASDGRTVSVGWDASHPQGLPLTYNIVYSADDGERSMLLARDLEGDEAELSLDGVPGGEGQLAVLATDGLRSSFAVSKPFAVDRKPPTLWITAPVEGAVFPPDQPISLMGQAVDVRTVKIESETLLWAVDGRVVQTGDGIAPVIGLDPGDHEATLSLRDAEFGPISASVRFRVAARNDAQRRYREVMGLD